MQKIGFSFKFSKGPLILDDMKKKSACSSFAVFQELSCSSMWPVVVVHGLLWLFIAFCGLLWSFMAFCCLSWSYKIVFLAGHFLTVINLITIRLVLKKKFTPFCIWQINWRNLFPYVFLRKKKSKLLVFVIISNIVDTFLALIQKRSYNFSQP